MKTNPITTATSSQISWRLVVVLVMLLLSNLNVFGQNTTVVPASVIGLEIVATDDMVATVTTATTTNNTMNFVSWFMGTKQTTNANSATDVSGNSKKQMINAGIAPNRLLIKAFLKKATNYDSTVA